MKKLIPTVFIILTCLVSCINGQEHIKCINGPLNAPDTLVFDSVETNIPVFLPVKMAVSGNHKLVVGIDKDEFAFMVFDLPLDGSGKKMGHIGRGPDEFLKLDYAGMTPAGEGVGIADMDGYYKTVRMNDEGMTIVNKEPTYMEGEFPNGCLKTRDGFLNVNLYGINEHNEQFFLIDKEGERNYIAPYPSWVTEDGDEDGIPPFFRGFSFRIVRPDGKRFVAVYGHQRKLVFYDLKGNKLNETSVEFPDKPVHKKSGNGMYYNTYSVYPCASNDRIVALCSNSYPDDNIEFKELHVFDWSGELLSVLHVPRWVTMFTVDFSEKKLYAMNLKTEDKIYYADVSKYL